ncbi:uncharacterized protein LOC130415858 [Triplophysa dalaica]|uniref:uncharacterized protein LOC130415858 n=1 Tax=Triplophysa dalaica TaxID=1582913 RepID=UPI0024DF54F8|nr:uncharacterized protein LOC130415858 [Triplophysa dalaica]
MANCTTKLDTMAADKHETELKVISWNVNGLKHTKQKNDQKLKDLKKVFGDFDIVLLQETHLGKKKADIEALTDSMKSMNINSEFDCEDIILEDKTHSEPGVKQGPVLYQTHSDSQSRGVAILVNKSHNCLKAYSEGGDFAWVYIDIDKKKYTFVSVYYHKDESGLMLRIHQSVLIHEPKAWTESILVIGGDFNTTLDPELDLAKPNLTHVTRRNEINEFIQDVKLVDVWREKNGGKKIQYTYSCKDPISRLDYVFMLKRDYEYVVNCVIPGEKKQQEEKTDEEEHVKKEEKLQQEGQEEQEENKEHDWSKISDHFPVLLTTRIIKNV